MTISPLIDQTLADILPLDTAAMDAARARQDTLTKPQGSLGRLEELSIILAGIFRDPMPRISRKAVILAAGDHGVVARGRQRLPPGRYSGHGGQLHQRRRGDKRAGPPRRSGT